MNVVNCIAGEHNLWLVLLAATVCVAGSWVALGLFQRGAAARGGERLGWLFLAGVAGGSSIWCTHFVAMLGYDPGVPVTFDAALTAVSLLIAIGGTVVGLAVGAGAPRRLAPAAGGGLVGLAVSAMHYTGMAAYRADGLVSWDAAYVAASVALAGVLGALSLDILRRPHIAAHKPAATGLFVAAVVSLHFTAMTAFQVTPLSLSENVVDTAAMQGMAMAIAVVGLTVIGAGLSSYLIDRRIRSDSYARLRHMAHHDPLTGLANRASFNEHLDDAIRRAARDGRRLAVIGIDLDRFKEINDLRGHGAGDEMLGALASRLSRCVGEGEFIARVGGDEFAAVKKLDDDDDALAAFLARLEATMVGPMFIDGLELATSASFGVAMFPRDGKDRELLVNNADLAMYRAKLDAGHVCFYERSMDEAVRERRALASDLQQAIRRDQLEVHYQVQTSVPTGEARGYEALLRWSHPRHGAISPAVFIPLAEDNGLILELGEWVLRRACAAAVGWRQPWKVAVNVSPLQFAHADLAEIVHRVLLETGLQAGRLELELTESTLMKDPARSLHVLRRIKALGVTVALDDFGTGHSSLGTLRNFPFDKIKLDRTFMREIESSIQAKAIVRAMLALGKSLGVPVLAEGIETEAQLSILRSEGCDEGQGFLLGRPGPRAGLKAGEHAAESDDHGAARVA